jgi:hypothetical protein
MQHERRGHVVGKVGHDHGLAALQDLRVVGAQGVGVMDGHAVGFHDRSQGLEEIAVDFHGVHLGAGFDERQGERSEPGADLEDEVARPTSARRAMRRTVLGSTTKF